MFYKSITRCLFALLMLPIMASAQYPVIFGDSLSDQGRVFERTGGYAPAAPYYQGRFSNGPVWSDYAFQGVSSNYAWGGATSGTKNILARKYGHVLDNTGFLTQLDEYLDIASMRYRDIGNNTHIIFLGANDFLLTLEDDEEKMFMFVRTIINNIMNGVTQLQAQGATDIVLMSLPDLSAAPKAREYGPVMRSLLYRLTLHFNRLLSFNAGRYNVDYFDTYKAYEMIIANAKDLGLEELVEPCLREEQTYIVCEDPERYLFWDDVHPTTQVHAVVAEAVKEYLVAG